MGESNKLFGLVVSTFFGPIEPLQASRISLTFKLDKMEVLVCSADTGISLFITPQEVGF